MILTKAQDIAVKVCNQLVGFCEPGLIRIAGSIRRKKEVVKDIEICVCPKTLVSGGGNLFGEDYDKHFIRSPKFIETVNSLGKIKKGKADDGKMMQIELPENIMLDLFIADETNFGNIFLIRTGDAEFSKMFMGTVLKRNGYHSEGGYVRKDDVIISTPNEEIVFDLAGIKVIKPQERNLITLQRQFNLCMRK